MRSCAQPECSFLSCSPMAAQNSIFEHRAGERGAVAGRAQASTTRRAGAAIEPPALQHATSSLWLELSTLTKRIWQERSGRLRRAGGNLAQQRLQFGEHLLDRIEVGRVGWQMADLGARCLDRRARPHPGNWQARPAVARRSRWRK